MLFEKPEDSKHNAMKNFKVSKENLQSLIKRISVIVIILLLWEMSARLGLLNAQILSSPSEIAHSFFQLITTRSLLFDVMYSVKRVLIGVIIGSLLGIIAALFLGLNRTVENYLGFIIEIIRPIPPIAWIPIAILWFGIGDAPAYFLVSLGAFFPLFTNIIKAIKNIESKYVNLALSLGASKSLVFRKILIPIVLPNLMTGLRVGIGVGWIIVITAEMVGAQSGLGYMIQLNRIMLQMPNVIVGMITIGIIGLLLSFAMNFIEGLIIPWQKRMSTIDRQIG
jgi:NitT/TauT family transport system permease protein/sulfonate transport system permease protein